MQRMLAEKVGEAFHWLNKAVNPSCDTIDCMCSPEMAI